ncbi:MAG: tetratricopeptide repeat protein, partial [Planctomycetota bacterium]
MLRRVACPVLVVLLLAGGLSLSRADDVPDGVRKFYDQAQSLLAEGKTKKAFSAICRGKGKYPDSVDFWALYVRLWRALGKKESTLWDKIVPKAQAKHPASATFDLLRARLESDPEKRVGWLEAATKKDPDAVEPRLLLAREYVTRGDDDQAEEILDAILEKDPANEPALVTKGELMIEGGRARSALDFAREHLKEADVPGLHHVAARALLVIAENDESKVAEAEAEARKAVAGRADPDYVAALARILDRAG